MNLDDGPPKSSPHPLSTLLVCGLLAACRGANAESVLEIPRDAGRCRGYAMSPSALAALVPAATQSAGWKIESRKKAPDGCFVYVLELSASMQGWGQWGRLLLEPRGDATWVCASSSRKLAENVSEDPVAVQIHLLSHLDDAVFALLTGAGSR